VSTFSILTQFSSGIFSQSNKTRERTKRDSNREGRIKLSLCADDMISCLKIPKDFTKKLLDLINFFSNVAGCKKTKKTPEDRKASCVCGLAEFVL
jgi:hypothetical protein